MIHERHQRVGSFDLKLDRSCPAAVRAAIVQFGHVLVTPTVVDPREFNDATVKAAARFTGVVTKPATDGEIGGWGQGWWLGGTNDHAGNAIEDTAIEFTAVSLAAALASLLPVTQPVAAGTVTTTGLSTVTGSYAMASRWWILQQLCALAGAEFVIQPDFTVDAAADTILFPTLTTPTVLLTTDPEPRDLAGLAGVELAKVEVSESWGQYATRVVVAGKSADGAQIAVGGATAGSVPYVDGRGNAMVAKRFVNAPSTPDADVATMAQAVLNLSTGRQSIALTARGDVRAVLAPGDGVWVWSLEHGLVDTGNQVHYQAETVAPVLLRCLGLDWPVTSGMGVYYRSGAGVYTDLTPYLEWEDGKTTTVIVGAGVGGVGDDTSAVAGSPTEGAISARWNDAVGLIAITDNQTSTSVLAASVGTTETVANLATPAVDTLPDRRYRITFTVTLRGLLNMTSFCSLRVRRGTGTGGTLVQGPVHVEKGTGTAPRETVTVTAYDTPGAQSAQQWCLTGQADASAFDFYSPSLATVEVVGPA